MKHLKSTFISSAVLLGIIATSGLASAAPAPAPDPLSADRLTSKVLTDVRTVHADIFSDAALGDDGVLTIETTVPLELGGTVAADVAAAAGKVRFKVVGGPNDNTKRQAIEAVSAIITKGAGVESGFITYDEPTERVVVRYTPKPGTTEVTGPSEVLGIPVDYAVSQVEAPNAAVMSGGTQLNLASDGSFQCTGGYTGTRNGRVGLITADHCPNNLRYESSTAIPWQTSAARSRGDAQFNAAVDDRGQATNSIWNRYIADAPNLQPVLKTITRTSFTDKNYVVCTFGQKTLRTQCAKVIDVRATIIYREGTYNNLVITGTTNTGTSAIDFGDSGGPWWLINADTVGVGITSGFGGYDANGVYCPRNCSYYSDLISVSSDMGVAVKVN